MTCLKLSRVGLLSLAALLTTGCFGRAGADAFFAGAIVTTAFMSAARAHTDEERQEAWEREHARDEAADNPRVIVVYVHDGVATPALPPPAPAAPSRPVPAAPPRVPFDAGAVRNALAAVDLGACRAAGAPRGYGHGTVTILPSGDISKVVIDEPAGMSPSAVSCVGAAIGRVAVPAFGGTSVEVRTTFFVP